MASNVTAYVGYNSFDIILYLSRLLQRLGRKVLIVDYNETKALTYSIPVMSGLDLNTEINSYMNVDFSSKVIDKASVAGYDDLLIDCGLGEPVFDTSVITKVVYVSDMFGFNLERLRQIGYYDRLPVKKELLIREASDIRLTKAKLASLLGKDICRIELLYHDEADCQNALLCHYNKIVSLAGISPMMKKYLLKQLQEILGNLSSRQLKAAFGKARWGEKRRVVGYEHNPVLVPLPWAGANK